MSQPALSPQPKPAQQSATRSTPQPPPSLPTLAEYQTELARLLAQVAELTDALTAAQQERDQERATRRNEQRAADALIESQKQALQQQSQALAQSQSALMADELVFLDGGNWIRPSMVREIWLSAEWTETISEQAKDPEGKLLWERNKDGSLKLQTYEVEIYQGQYETRQTGIPVMLPDREQKWRQLVVNNETERLATTRTPDGIAKLIAELKSAWTANKPKPLTGPLPPSAIKSSVKEPAKP